MARFFNRRAKVTVGDLEIAGLTLVFRAEKRIDPDPNTLDLTIVNLSEERRAALQNEWPRIVLEAGYEDSSEILYSGEAHKIDHVQSGKDWNTRIQCGDGARAFANARSEFSFRENTDVVTVIKQLANDLGVNAKNALHRLGRKDWPGASEKFLQGYTACGLTVRELDRVLGAAGLEWSIQDGNLQILKPDEAAGVLDFTLTPETGLIGAPHHGSPSGSDPSVLHAKSLLNAAIRPGWVLDVESKGVKGRYRVKRVVHHGDLAGTAWYSEFDAVQAEA